MGTLAWLFVLGVGVLVSFFAGRFCAPRTVRLSNLERERDAATAELRRYREEVGTHFEKTGKLFDQLTGDYRSLYEHLAEGATRLGLAEQGNVLQAEPEQRKLTHAGDTESSASGDEGGSASSAEEPSPRKGAAEEPAGHRAADTSAANADSSSTDKQSKEKQDAAEPTPTDQSTDPEGKAKPDGEGDRQQAAGEDSPTQRPPADYASDEKSGTAQSRKLH